MRVSDLQTQKRDLFIYLTAFLPSKERLLPHNRNACDDSNRSNSLSVTGGDR